MVEIDTGTSRYSVARTSRTSPNFRSSRQGVLLEGYAKTGGPVCTELP
jgi:hypothetical protein